MILTIFSITAHLNQDSEKRTQHHAVAKSQIKTFHLFKCISRVLLPFYKGDDHSTNISIYIEISCSLPEDNNGSSRPSPPIWHCSVQRLLVSLLIKEARLCSSNPPCREGKCPALPGCTTLWSSDFPPPR